MTLARLLKRTAGFAPTAPTFPAIIKREATMGKHLIESFYPAPGVDAPRLQVCHWGGKVFGSQALREEVADYFGAHPDDVECVALEWGEDEAQADFYRLNGRIIGAVGLLADIITDADWREILARQVVPLSM